jgi:hypothetical protein
MGALHLRSVHESLTSETPPPKKPVVQKFIFAEFLKILGVETFGPPGFLKGGSRK